MRRVVKTHEDVNLLKHLLFRKQARKLLRLQRQSMLEFSGTESDKSSLNDELENIKDSEEKKNRLVQSLTGWTVRSSMEKKLVLGIMHKKVHKNFEEDDRLHDVNRS